MAKYHSTSRRKFLRQLGTTSLLLGTGSLGKLAAEQKMEERVLQQEKRIT